MNFQCKSICSRLLSTMFCCLLISCLPADKTGQDVSQLYRKSLSHNAREKYTALFRILKALISAKVSKSVYIKNISLEVIHCQQSQFVSNQPMSYIITNLTMWAIRSPKGFGINPHLAEKRCTLLLQATFGHTVVQLEDAIR